jgi:hypothetical protein
MGFSNVEFRKLVNEEYTRRYNKIYEDMKKKYPKYTKQQLHFITRGLAVEQIADIEKQIHILDCIEDGMTPDEARKKVEKMDKKIKEIEREIDRDIYKETERTGLPPHIIKERRGFYED